MINHNAILLLICLLLSCTGKKEPHLNTVKAETSVSEQASPKPPAPKHGFYSALLDNKGVLWFATRGSGIFRYSKGRFTNFTTEDGLCDNDISCIAEDRKGNLWFGTTNGLCRFDGREFTHLGIPQSDTSSIWLDKVYPVVNPNQVMSVLEDSHGMLWIGTNGTGVYRYNGRTFEHFLSDIGMVYEDGRQHNIVLSIIEDLSGNIWFSSLSHGGVSRFDGQHFTHFTDELSDDFIRVLYCDSKGVIWIGTHGNHEGGMDSYNGKEFQTYYKTNDGFSHNNVMWIHEEPDGTLWIASGTSYLGTFDGSNFHIFEEPDGRKYHNVSFVTGDSSGHIWFGNQDGLWRYDGASVEGIY